MPALTSLGFKRPTFDELLEGQIAKAKELFGEDIETHEQTPLGKFIRITVNDLASVYEDLEGVYYARFPNTASGVNLDRLCPFVGITRNAPTYAIHQIKIIGVAGAELEPEFVVGTALGVNFLTEDAVIIGEDGTAVTDVRCMELGSVGNVAIGSITEVVNPIASVSEIEHISQIEYAQNEETDVELRQRFSATLSAGGTSTIESIMAEIMRVPNVEGCVIRENATSETDENGLPPHSFECFVLAPESQNYSIAEAIFNKKPLGIKAHGNTSVEVTDSSGTVHLISFSKTQEVAIYVKATVSVSNKFPADGVDQIKYALVDYINSFKNGKDVVYSTLFSHIHSVDGVEEVTSLLLSSDGASYSAANIPCSSAQYARLNLANVQVEVTDYADQ